MTPALVPVHDVDRIWPHIRGLLEKGCARVPETAYRWRLGEIEQMCRSGNGYLIVAYEPEPFVVHMASVWQFVPDENSLGFRCQVLGGRGMNRWLGAARTFITAKAKEGQADKLIAAGRAGWRRVFPDAREVGSEMEMDI
jgi:hypothetical protein